MVHIRQEKFEDAPAIRAVNEQAFGQPQEANIVDMIRANCPNFLSLVAVFDRKIVGHILFSPAIIGYDRGTVEGMGLAPMAVLPKYQRQGIGSALIRQGIDILNKQSCPFIIVLGHPGYYPRFGFEPASIYGIKCNWKGVPDNAFMVMFLDNSLKQCRPRIAKYRDEFNEAMRETNKEG